MNYPEKFPGFQQSPSAASAGSITLTSFPATFDPLAFPIKLVICEYDMTTRSLTRVFTGASFGPILIHKKECIEVHWVEKTQNQLISERVHWLNPNAADNTISLLMRETRTPDGSGYIDDADIRFPKQLTAGNKFTHVDFYFRGSETAEQAFQESVEGPFEIKLGDSSHRCLRMTARQVSSAGRITQSFIDADSGQLLIIRSLLDAETLEKQIPGANSKLEPDEDGFYCVKCWMKAG
jgi:hypothetical protein